MAARHHAPDAKISRRFARSARFVSALSLVIAGASLVACGGAAPADGDDAADRSGSRPAKTPTDPDEPTVPVPGDPEQQPPQKLTVGDAVDLAAAGYLPRGVTKSGDVLLSRADANARISYHAVPITGGAITAIESNLIAADAEGSVQGDVVEIRKAPPSQRTGAMSIWSRAGGLKSLGTVVRHYDGFASSDDGKRVAYVTSNGDLKLGAFGAASTVATGLNTANEDCIPHIELVGSRVVASTCTGSTTGGGDLRVWDANGAVKTLTTSGVGYNGFTFGDALGHALYDSGAIGAPLMLVDFATGVKTTIEAGRASGAHLASDGKTVIYRSSSRSEIRVWRSGTSALLLDRATSFRVSPDRKWVAATRTFPTPAKLVAVDVATGAQTEIADNAYTTAFTGDSARLFFKVDGEATLRAWDLAAKKSETVGTITSYMAVPGRAEGFALECPASPNDYEAPVCKLSLVDAAAKTSTPLDDKVSRRVQIHEKAIVYVKEGRVLARPLS